METWEAIRARRNVRRYSDEPISAQHLDQILEAGRRAPSASNTQPWDFVVCTDRAQLQALAEVWRGAGHVASSAATVVLVAPITDDARRSAMNEYDLGQATMAMMLAATDLGIGSGHAAIGEQELARQLLGVPDDHVCLYLLAFGYPADRPLSPLKSPTRRAFEDVVHRGRW